MLKRIKRLVLGTVIGILVLTGVAFLLARTLGDREKLYEGKPLAYWIEQMNQGPGASNQPMAVITNRIIPALTEAMLRDTNDSRIRFALIGVLNQIPGIWVYATPAPSRRSFAANSIGRFGPAARCAIPVLIQAVKGNDAPVRGTAVSALGEIGCEPDVVIPALIACLGDDDVNDEAAEALGKFGSLAKAAVPKLIPLLKVPDKDLHTAVVEALRKIDPEAAAKAGVK